MNFNKENIPVKYLSDEDTIVNLKWFRGAGRYNNGAIIYQRK